MPPRVFKGYLARGIPETFDSRWMPPHMQEFQLVRAQARVMCDRLVGKPVCNEHDEGVVIGRVERARVKANGDWRVHLRLNEGQKAAEDTAAFVDLGFARSLSLQHDASADEPIEVTVCQVPARPGSVITRGAVPMTATKIPHYDQEWNRVKASARVRAHAPSRSVVSARLLVAANMNHPNAPMQSPIPGEGTPIGAPMHAYLSTLASPSAPGGGGGPAAPPASPMAEGVPSAPAAQPPVSLASPPAAAPPAGAAPTESATAAAAATGDVLGRLLSAAESSATAHTATQKDREELVVAATATAEEMSRLRTELAVTKSAMAQRDAADSARVRETAAKQWEANERSGLTPPGTASAMRHDMNAGGIEAARAEAARALGGGVGPTPSASEPSFVSAMGKLRAFASQLVTHRVPPQTGAMEGMARAPTASSPYGHVGMPAGGAPAAAAPMPYSHMVPTAAMHPGYHGSGVPSFFTSPVGAAGGAGGGYGMGAMSTPGMHGGMPHTAHVAAHMGGGGTAYGYGAWPPAAHHPSAYGGWPAPAAAPPAPPAAPEPPPRRLIAAHGPTAHLSGIPIPGEGEISVASGLPIGRAMHSREEMPASHYKGIVKASMPKYDGQYLSGKDRGAWSYDDVDLSDERHRNVYATMPDAKSDRSAALGWGRVQRTVGRAPTSVGENLAQVDVPPPQYFPSHLKVQERGLYDLFWNGNNSAVGGVMRLLPESYRAAGRDNAGRKRGATGI